MMTADKPARVAVKHLGEWVDGSGVDEAIARANIESISPKELNQRVQPAAEIKTGGWWCRGVDWRTGRPLGNRMGQGKPDKPHVVDPNKKPAKYLTASGVDPDAGFLEIPGNPDYWLNTWSDKSAIRVWTEGAKKAGAILSAGWAGLFLTGVWNWGKDGKLAYEVEKWATPGTTHALAFDSDYLEKPECCKALKAFGSKLASRGCTVLIVTWDSAYKGADDLIVAMGREAFGDRVRSAQKFDDWLKGLEGQMEPKKPKRLEPKASEIARELAERYRPFLAYDPNLNQWYRYEAQTTGIWSPETQHHINAMLQAELDSKPGFIGYSSGFVKSVRELLQSYLLVSDWEEPEGILPFRNGVLDLNTMQLHGHAPANRLLWSLPRDYDPEASDWDTIAEWMDFATGGDRGLQKILLCFLNATLKRRADLQRFLHLTGPGGTGKGTFTRLAIALIGSQNTHSTSLSAICSDKYDLANCYRKRLVALPDEDTFHGGLSKFKSLTGQDPLRAEFKFRSAFAFTYDGMVLVGSNFPIFSGDHSSGMSRRALVVPFTHSVPAGKRKNLDRAFAPELPALTNYVLSIPDEVVTDTLLQLSDPAPAAIAQTWEYRMRSDNLASWVNDWLIPTGDLNDWAFVGQTRDDAGSLYASYSAITLATGGKPRSNREFSPALMDLLSNQLGWKVELARSTDSTSRRKVLRGVRIRMEYDRAPYPIEALSERPSNEVSSLSTPNPIRTDSDRITGSPQAPSGFEVDHHRISDPITLNDRPIAPNSDPETHRITDPQKQPSNPYAASGDPVIRSTYPLAENFSEGKNDHLTAENFSPQNLQTLEPQALERDGVNGGDRTDRPPIAPINPPIAQPPIASNPDRANGDPVKSKKPATEAEAIAKVKDRRYRVNDPTHKRHGAIVRVQGRPGEKTRVQECGVFGSFNVDFAKLEPIDE